MLSIIGVAHLVHSESLLVLLSAPLAALVSAIPALFLVRLERISRSQGLVLAGVSAVAGTCAVSLVVYLGLYPEVTLLYAFLVVGTLAAIAEEAKSGDAGRADAALGALGGVAGLLLGQLLLALCAIPSLGYLDFWPVTQWVFYYDLPISLALAIWIGVAILLSLSTGSGAALGLLARRRASQAAEGDRVGRGPVLSEPRLSKSVEMIGTASTLVLTLLLVVITGMYMSDNRRLVKLSLETTSPMVEAELAGEPSWTVLEVTNHGKEAIYAIRLTVYLNVNLVWYEVPRDQIPEVVWALVRDSVYEQSIVPYEVIPEGGSRQYPTDGLPAALQGAYEQLRVWEDSLGETTSVDGLDLAGFSLSIALWFTRSMGSRGLFPSAQYIYSLRLEGSTNQLQDFEVRMEVIDEILF